LDKNLNDAVFCKAVILRNGQGNIMNIKTVFNFTAILSLLCLLQVASAAAQTYQVIIYEPTAGFSDTEGFGLRGQQRVGAGRIAGSTSPEHTHAFLWTGTSTAPIALHPSNFTYSAAFDTDGTRQVGYVENNLFPQVMRRAALWSGSANSLIVLSNKFSEAAAIGGDQQVGYVDDTFTCSECGPTGGQFAALWRGTAQSLVNLHPPLFGCRTSQAADTDGVQQVGNCFFQIPQMTSNYRALLWSGTAQSAVVLHPANYFNSFALSVKNGVQVGFGNTGTFPNLNPSDALLWRGTAQSVVVLGRGTALGTNGTTHVGEVDGGNNRSNAFRWDGVSGAGFNLHTLLPAGVYENSTAEEIDTEGNIFGTAQFPNGRTRAVQWRVTNTAARQTLYDFDGDGKSDVSVYRNGEWFMQKSRDGFSAVAFGASSDKIAPADYDGDGKTDVAVFREGAWYVLRSLDNAFSAVSFGSPEDKPLPADYDGDGRADYAVFRPSNGTWYLLRSALGFTGTAFGQNGDIPVPGDYDGDGKTDICVF